jgi:hypothetical protein
MVESLVIDWTVYGACDGPPKYQLRKLPKTGPNSCYRGKIFKDFLGTMGNSEIAAIWGKQIGCGVGGYLSPVIGTDVAQQVAAAVDH